MTHRSQSGGLRAVPDPPPHYVPRQDAVAEVERALLAGTARVGISAVGQGRLGVLGLGGIGKTVLAAAVARRRAIRERFADGVLWLTVGQEPELTTLQAQLARALGHKEVFASAGEGHLRLRELCADRAVLLVLDDVWEIEHASHLDVVGEGGRLLMTTRNRDVLTGLGAEEHRLDVLSMDEARVLLADWVGCAVAALPGEAEGVAELCGRLPLALAMIGAMVREGEAWRDVGESLAHADIEDIAHRMQDYPYEDVLRAMEVSVGALPGELRERYVDLALFGEDEAVSESALAVLWQVRAAKVRRVLGKLAARSLVLRDRAGEVRLHDLQRMYVRARAGDLAARHSALVDAYARECPEGLARGPSGSEPDRYFFARLPVHLRAAGREGELRGLLWQHDWLDAKLRAVGAAELIADYERIACDDELGLVRDALRLSSHVIDEDADQLSGQLVGRLGDFEEDRPRIRELLAAVRARTRHAWLCPVVPTLTPPGGPLVRTLAGHGSVVTAVAVTPDGKRAVSASWDNTLKVWDVDSGRELRTLVGHSAGVNAVAVTADGKRAVSASADQTLRVWDVDSGRELRCLVGHSAGVWAVAMTADGERAISASEDETLKVWDLNSGRELHTLAGHSAGVWAVAVTTDGERAVSASEDGTLKVWDVDSGRELRVLTGHTGRGRTVAVTADGKWGISASGDQTLKVWDVDSGRELRVLTGHSDLVWAVAIVADGTRAVSASGDGTLKVWDVNSGRELGTLVGHSDWVLAVAMTTDGKRVVSGSLDGTLKVWDLESDSDQRALTGHSHGINAVTVTSDGKRAVSASEDGTLKVWDVDSGRELCSFTGHSDKVWAVALTADGKRAVSASEDGTLKVWELDSGRELRTLTGHSHGVHAVAVTADGKRVISASGARMLKVWDVDSGRELRSFTGHSGTINAVAVTADGARAVSASRDRMLKVWEVASGRELRALVGHWRRVQDVAVMADGTRAISASWDYTLKVWELDSGRELQTLTGHSGVVWAVAVTADGKRAVSASWDKTLRVWDLATGQTVLTFTGEAQMTACATSPRGDILIAGDHVGRIYILRLIKPGAQPRPALPAPLGEDEPAPHEQPPKKPKRVFISYTRDSDEHQARVLALADRLREEGIDARIDQYEPHPAEGWPRWMQRQIKAADVILMICTPTYRRRFDGDEEPGRGKGGVFEGLLILQKLHDSGTRNQRIVPVLMDGESDRAIPDALRDYTHYALPEGYDDLYRRLTEQPAIVKPDLGEVRPMPPRKRG